jgi:hypothetical protein
MNQEIRRDRIAERRESRERETRRGGERER